MWLLCTKGYGFTVKDIDSSCPADLEPYAEAYKLEMKQRDREMWMWWGEYGLAATSVAVDHCLNGRKAQSKYIDKPIIERADIANNEKKFRSKGKRSLQDLWQCRLVLNYHIQKGETNMSLTGIDVSSYQGTINWWAVKQNGIDFAILKVIRKDLNPDKKFEENWKGCKEHNVHVHGVYEYGYITTVAKSRSDARRVLTILNGRKVTVYLDVEDAVMKGLGKILFPLSMLTARLLLMQDCSSVCTLGKVFTRHTLSLMAV